MLQCIEAWAAQIVVRYSLDEMFDIQWTLWGDSVLPGTKKLKAEYLGITGNTVADWMKDLQIDATALPGKAFDLSFEMPEPDVGIMTFNRCVAVDQWETMGRPDILEKNCHSTCPKSMIKTTAMYNPNMKVDILAIPPRVDDRQRVLQVEIQHARRGRPRVRPGRADEEAGRITRPVNASLTVARAGTKDNMIVVGVLLLLIGLLTGLSILSTVGFVLIIVGAVLWILGAVGHEVGGRRHYY